MDLTKLEETIDQINKEGFHWKTRLDWSSGETEIKYFKSKREVFDFIRDNEEEIDGCLFHQVFRNDVYNIFLSDLANMRSVDTELDQEDFDTDFEPECSCRSMRGCSECLMTDY